MTKKRKQEIWKFALLAVENHIRDIQENNPVLYDVYTPTGRRSSIRGVRYKIAKDYFKKAGYKIVKIDNQKRLPEMKKVGRYIKKLLLAQS